jgi:hypothetical protein
MCSKHFFLEVLAILFWTITCSGQLVLIPEDSEWKYLDDGSDQDTSWRLPGFIDSLWAAGNAELGYGDGDETTTLSYGGNSSNKYITYYFRKQFVVTNPDTTLYLKLRLLRDDGAVVYLNGTEIKRSNMPDDSIHYQTLAASTVGGSAEDTFYEFLIPSESLIADTNLAAVEIHQRSVTSSDISFNMELTTTDSIPPQYRKAPYLIYTGVNSEMKILWQMHETMSCSLSWGNDTTYAMGNVITTEYGTDHQHTYTIPTFDLGTKYHYRVIANQDTATGTFYTGPADTATAVTILAYGDTRTYPANHNAVAEQVILNYQSNPNDQTLMVLSGDLVGTGDNEPDWDEQFFDPQYTKIQEMLRTVPIMAATGNHEGTGLLFSKYFPYPFYSGGNHYFSFDYGPVHVCIIDQYTSYSAGSTQYQWLVSDLAASDKPWKMFVLHEPGWSAGGGHGNEIPVQTELQPLCIEYGVQFVIAGHNHYYARAEVDRIEHITTGGGGAPLHTPDPGYPNIVTTQKDYHFCTLRFSADTVIVTAIDKDGSVIETFDYQRFWTWSGAADSDWHNEGNWARGAVPTSISDVVIPANATNMPVINDSITINKLDVRTGATLDINTPGALEVTGENP